jgi:hypothetical protein
MKKSGQSKPSIGVKDMGSPFHGQKVKGYADGGEVLKQEGLAASNKEYEAMSGVDKARTSFKRLFEGNIDDPNSVAYKKYGAGRGQTERDFKAADAQIDELDAIRKRADEKPAVTTVAPRTPKQDMVNDQDTSSRPEQKAPDTFGKAFAAARKAGKKTFEWQGKSYSTKMKDNTPAAGKGENESKAETKRLERNAKNPPKSKVPARPKLNWSTPADRTRWDQKYKATHNQDGTPK